MAERTPTNTSSPVASRTIARCRSDQPTIRVSNHTSLLLAEGALQDRALEREDALDDDLLTTTQPAENLDPALRRSTDGDGVQLEVAVGMAHEHDVPLGHLRDRRERNDHAPRRALGGTDDRARRTEEADLHQIAVVPHQDSRGYRARRRIEPSAARLDLRVEDLGRAGGKRRAPRGAGSA